MHDNTVIIRTVAGTRRISAKLHGQRNVIELYWGDMALRASAQPFEVINLFDYELGRIRIPRTQAAVHREVCEWYSDLGDRAERQAAMDTYYANAGSKS